MPAVRQTSFAAGELSPSLWGRWDLPVYAHGLRRCSNFIPTRQGNLISRPGTEAVAQTVPHVRLIPFVFSASDSVVVELRDRAIRFYSRAKPLTKPEGGAYEITSPFTWRELRQIRFVQMGNVITLTHPDHPPHELIRRSVDPHEWELRPLDFKLHKTEFMPVHDYRPYLREQKFTVVKGEQRDDVEPYFDSYSKARFPSSGGRRESGAREKLEYIIAHAKNEAKNEEDSDFEGKFPGLSDSDWAYRYFRLAAHFTKEEKLQYPRAIWHYQMTYIVRRDDGSEYETLPVPIVLILRHRDNLERKPDDPNTWYRRVDEGRYPNNLIIYPSKPQYLWLGRPASGEVVGARIYRGRDGVFGLVGEVRTPHPVTNLPDFIDRGDAPDFHRPPPKGTDPTKEDGCPTALTYFDHRLVLGGFAKKPEQLWASAVNNLGAGGFDIKALSVASDSLRFELASRRREQILHLVGLDSLLVFTSSSVWAVEGGGGAPLSATDIPTARVQMETGSGDLAPLVAGNTVLFASPRGTKVRDLFYDWQQRSYVGNDLTMLAEHLFREGAIKEWAYAEDPHGIVWAIQQVPGEGTWTTQGRLLSLTYDRERGQAAWAHHELGGNLPSVQSLCVVPEEEGDVLYLAVSRQRTPTTTTTTIERLSFGAGRRYGLDCQMPDPRWSDEEKGLLSWPLYYSGMDLHAIVGGQVVGPFKPDAKLEARGPVEAVGFPFQPELELLDIAADGTRTKNVKQVIFEVEASRGLWVGETFDRLTEWRQRTVADGYGAPGPHTGAAAVRIGSTWNRGGRAVLRQVDPLPLTIYGVTREVEFGG